MFTFVIALLVSYVIVSTVATGIVLGLNGAHGRDWAKLFLSPLMLPLIVYVFVKDLIRKKRG